MKRLRKIIFWCHLPVGVIAGLVILLMSVTGVLLTYEKQIMAWADTRNYQVERPTPDARRLPLENLLNQVRVAETQAAPTTITLRAEPTAPAAIALTGGRTIFVNPYTGTILGDGAPGVRAFFRFVTDWHRWLGAHGENRAVARAITGACNLGFLFLVVSGFYLWWPRNWTWAQVRSVLWFKRGLVGRARDFNWHNAIGLWTVLPLFIVVISATVISYPWATNLVYRLVGETPPAPRSAPPPAPAGAQATGGAQSQPAENLLDGLEQSWARAEQQVADWRSISLRLPTTAEAPLTFTIDQGTGGQPQKRAQLQLDRRTNEVVQWEPFASFTLGRQIRSIMRFAHTGEVAGLIGQTIAGLASAGGAVLVWTGLALAWRRFWSWRARRSNQAGELTGTAELAPSSTSD